MKRFFAGMIFFLLVLAAPASAITNRTLYSVDCLTGDGCADAMLAAELKDGDGLIVYASTGYYFYIVDADSGATASPPEVIDVVGAGDMRLVRQDPYGVSGASQEQIEDYIGAMLTGNTETGISVEYQDDDGTIDFAVSESDPVVGAITGIPKADGAGAISAAVAGTDYQAPLVAGTDYLAPDGDGSGLSGVVTSESDSVVGAVSGIVKANGAGAISAAVAGTDYQAPLAAGTDYLAPTGDGSGLSGVVTSEVDGSTTNEVNTVTGDNAATTTGLAITIAGAGIASTAVAGDTLTVTATEVDGSTTNEVNTITADDANTTTGLAITVAGGGIAATTVAGDTVTVTATEVDSVVGAITGLVQADGGGNISAAVAGTDYAAADHDATHAVSGTDTVFPADPGADRYLMWDDDPGALVWSEVSAGGLFDSSTGIATAADATLQKADPKLILQNTDEEDTSAGRQSVIEFKGEQSGGEVSTLATITASHSGTSDDEKGQIVFAVNDGNDGAAPTAAVKITAAGTVGFTAGAYNTAAIFFDNDTDLGIYGVANTGLRLQPGGSSYVLEINNAGTIKGSDVNAGGIFLGNASGTVPTLRPRAGGDGDTGIGSSGEDQLSLISGAVEMMRLVEDAADYVETKVGTAYTPAADQARADDSTITIDNTIVRVAGDGGAALLDTDPAIEDGAVDGQIVIIQGTHDTNTVQIADSVNTQLNGAAAVTLGQGDIIQLVWDAGDSTWYECYRSNN